MPFDLDWTKIVTGIVLFFCTTLVSFLYGRWRGWYLASNQWHKKHFLGRIIVSINCFNDGCLKIRTIFERSLEEIFLNSIAIEKVTKAAHQTTVENPILPIDKKDRWYLLNFVLNAVSEHFVSSLVRYDAGVPMKPVRYLLFLTAELVGDDRIRKVRAMMLRKELFDDFPYLDSMPKLENEWHADRILTLRKAIEVYKKEPDNFLVLEVYV